MAAPTPVASAEALVSAIQKSGLLPGEALAKLREVAAKSPEPKLLARDLVRTGTLTRWQAEQLLYGFHRLIIGKYKLLDQLGTAPTGRLYLAEHAQMGRRHTIKVLAKRLAANPAAVKQFLAAAQTACGLDHRNISHVYDVIQDHERHSHYVVMEYVEGMDLDTLVQREGRLAPLEALDFLIQAAEGLSHAHAGGVVHGDLKPSNLLLDQTGTIKILEIGQAGTGATPQTDPVDESIEMAALGAVIFQPPELRGEAQVPEISADVYSLGSVLAFLLTGQASVDAATAIARLKEQPDLPHDLIAFCGGLMADKPADRPATMGRVLEQLTPIVRQLVAAAKKSKPDEEARRPVIEVGEAAVGNAPSKIGKTAEAKTPVATTPVATTPIAKTPIAKTPVAKVIAEAAPGELIISTVPSEVVDPAAAKISVVQTQSRMEKRTPVAKPVEPTTEQPAEVPEAVEFKGPADSVYGPVIVYSAIGSGIVLVLALVVAVLCFWLVGRREGRTASTSASNLASAAASQLDATASGQQTVDTKLEGNTPGTGAVGQGGSSNAAAPDESLTNVTAANETIANVTKGSEPNAQDADKNAVGPAPAQTTSVPAEVEPQKSVAETKPAPKAAPKSATVAPKAPPKFEPFKGLAAAIALPALVEASGQAVAARPLPVELGPCSVPADKTVTAELLGGEGAVRGTRHKFELQAKADQPRVWEALLSGAGSPAVIGTFSVGAGKLLFEWTEEGLKQATAAKQLCNCTIKFTSAGATHSLALRHPVRGNPLVIEIERPGATKWNIGDLPLGKQVFIEVTRVEGFKDALIEPKQVASGAPLAVWLGDNSKSLPLKLELDTASTARDLEIKQQPYIKLEDQDPRIYRRKELLGLHQQSLQRSELIGPELKKMRDSRPTRDVEKLLKEQRIDALGKQQLALGKTMEQINFATGFAERFGTSVQVHFRVYYQSGDTKLELLRTEEPPTGRK